MKDQLTKTLIQVLGALVLQIITARAAASKAAAQAVDETTGFNAGKGDVQGWSNAGSAGKGGEDRMNYESQDEGMSSFVPGLLIGGIIGALIGAAAALWFAPQSGEQTQEKLRQEAIKLKQSANETLGEVKSSLDSTAGAVREKAEDVYRESQHFVDQQAGKVSQAASSVQGKVSAR